MFSIGSLRWAVFDFGCGTGILGILAAKMGASSVIGVDIEKPAYENAQENIRLNQVSGFEVVLGDLDAVPESGFDIILANINRNILLQEMAQYAKHPVLNGRLQLSGFYAHDIPELVAEAGRHGLSPVSQDEREQWATLGLVRLR